MKLLAIAGAGLLWLSTGMAQSPPPPGPNGSGPLNDQGQGAAPANISPAAADIVNLAGTGTSEQQLVARIQSSPNSFNLSADDVIYLKDVGLSSAVINAMLSHDGQGRMEAGTSAQTAPPLQPEEPLPQQPQQPPVVTGPLVPGQQYSSEPPPTIVTAPPTEVNYFYSDLSPYGTWVQLDGVGWCWQPRAIVLNRGWRPYCDSGHWVWTDTGWYWQSDYSWGWAPFHYGRWYQHPRCGWVWTPDTTWGPAWVVWRSGGDYCGWAPVPPGAVFDVRLGGWRWHGGRVSVGFDFGLGFGHFTFVSLGNFAHRDLGRYRIGGTEVTRIYNRTTIINNYTVNNNRVVNRGLPVERVAAATHHEFRPVQVRDVRSDSRTVVRAHIDERGGTPVFRSEIQRPERVTSVRVQKVDERHPIVHQTPVVAARNELNFNGSERNFNGSTSYQNQRNQPALRNDQRSNERISRERGYTGSTTTAPSRTTQGNERGEVRSAPLTPTYRSESRDTQPARRDSRDYSPSPRSEARPQSSERSSAPVATAPSVPRSESRDYRNDSRDSRQATPQYQPKTYYQAPDSRSSSRGEARGDTRRESVSPSRESSRDSGRESSRDSGSRDSGSRDSRDRKDK